MISQSKTDSLGRLVFLLIFMLLWLLGFATEILRRDSAFWKYRHLDIAALEIRFAIHAAIFAAIISGMALAIAMLHKTWARLVLKLYAVFHVLLFGYLLIPLLTGSAMRTGFYFLGLVYVLGVLIISDLLIVAIGFILRRIYR